MLPRLHQRAGAKVTLQGPNPIRCEPLSQTACMDTVSPSSIQLRFQEPPSHNGSRPFLVSSSRQPCVPGPAELIVPEAITSPARMLQPPAV